MRGRSRACGGWRTRGGRQALRMRLRGGPSHRRGPSLHWNTRAANAIVEAEHGWGLAGPRLRVRALTRRGHSLLGVTRARDAVQASRTRGLCGRDGQTRKSKVDRAKYTGIDVLVVQSAIFPRGPTHTDTANIYYIFAASHRHGHQVICGHDQVRACLHALRSSLCLYGF